MLDLQDKFEKKLGIGDLTQFKDKVYTGRFLRAGKMEYAEDGEVINIPQEALEKIANSHIGVPVIIKHTTLTKQNLEQEKVGSVARVFINNQGFTDGKGKFHQADGWAWCDFVITDKYAVDLLENQNWELSNSYFPKKTNSNQYDVDKDVIDGVGLHLAIVPKGRYDTQVVMNNSQPNKKTMLDTFKKQIKEKVSDLMDLIKSNDNSMETKQENLEINNSSETVDNPCGSKKYENQYFTLENGEQLGIDQVIDTLTEYQNAEVEKKKKEEEMNNAKKTLEMEYEVNGQKMKGKDMLDMYKTIKGLDRFGKDEDKLSNEKEEDKEEDKEEEEKEIKDNKLAEEDKEEEKEEDKEEKEPMENKTKNNAEPSNAEMQKLNYAKELNPLEKAINNSFKEEAKIDNTNDIVIMNPFK